MILSQEAARIHLEWLLSMKDRFLQHLKALKQITIPYLKDGTWIKALQKMPIHPCQPRAAYRS
jgi:hypothetical protein